MTQSWSNDPSASPMAGAAGADGAQTRAAEPSAYPRGAAPRTPEPVEFTGTGQEYFRIWAVNLCLSVLTLGLYSPWAKVRKMQYFYRHTRLAGATFDYHGKPLAILKGRLIVGGLVAAYYGLGYVSPIAGGVVGLAMLCLSPWFFLQSMKFRMANTSYRGLRFRFRGSKSEAAKLLLLWPMLVGCTCYLLTPHWLWKLKKFEFEETSFGRTRFSFGAESNDFFAAYIMGWLLSLPLAIAGGVATAAFMPSFEKTADGAPPNMQALIVIYAIFAVGVLLYQALIHPYVAARIQQRVWSKLGLGAHGFVCELSPGPVVSLSLKNLALTLLTFGFYAPYAAVAMTKLRAESVCLLPGAPLDDFMAADGENVSAFADAVGDYADYDFGL